MSGSYDKTGRPAQVTELPARQSYYFEDSPGTATTGAPMRSFDTAPPHPYRQADPKSREPAPKPHLEADARADIHGATPGKGQTHAAIVPSGSVTGRSLTLVISIMCFLACLTAGAVYLIRQSADAWLRDVASEVTVQIEAADGTDIDKLIGDVSAYLRTQDGINRVDVMSIEESARLLEPWLGNLEGITELPVPRLIALQLDRSKEPSLEAIRATFASKYTGVTLDDHRQWQKQIRTVTHSFALGGLAILLLVAAATTAIIVTATRSAMTSNREIVEVLHFVGATDRFIAREFEKNFLRLGIRAGLVGAFCAMAVFFLLPTGMELLGGGSLTNAEVRRMIGTGALDLKGYGMLGIVVIVVAALCMLTSRFGVYRILNSRG